MEYIFAHGMGQTGEDWRETVSHMEGVEVRCPELREMSAGDVCYENMKRGFFGYCDGFEGEICLCGLSLGAMLALEYAAARPERVKSMVLIGAQYNPPKNLLKVQDMIFRVMPEKSFEGTGLGKSDFIRLSRAMAELDLTDMLPKVTCKTLVMIGEKDKPNKKAAEGLAGMLPLCEMKVIAGAGHEVNKDRPRELAETLMRFYETT
ncbi:MAG: alpha/beta hydrolase [Ruminococcus sp.]|nr:alpha/beta hydrolase [Ruminococcus sp.]